MSCRFRAFVPFFLVFLLCINFPFGAARTFTAAPRASRLKRQGLNFEPRFDQQILAYIEASSSGDAPPSGAVRLTMDPKLPTLVLDDYSEQIQDISCVGSEMTVNFSAGEELFEAESSWKAKPEIVFITSHSNCAAVGEHGVYIVTYQSTDPNTMSITLHTSLTSIKKVSQNLRIDLGSHVLPDIEHRFLTRRTESETTSTHIYTQSASKTPSTAISFASPTATATGPAASGDISFSRKDTTLLPPDSTIAALLPNPNIVNGIVLKCKNCTMNGRIELKAAGFEMNDSEIEVIVDFFDNGFFEFTASGLSAHMEFELDFLPGFKESPFTASLPSIPLGAIDIVGVVTIGPTLNLNFPMAIVLNSPINITTGFTVTVPDQSMIVLNVSDIESSNSHGFQDAKIAPLPLKLSAADISVNITAGFRPELLLGAGVGPKSSPISISGGVGTFFDLPSLTSSITTLHNVNDQCSGPAKSGTNNTFIHVDSSAKFAVGTLWNLDASIPDLPNFSRGNQVELFSKTVPLRSECLKWSSKTTSVVRTRDATVSNVANAKNSPWCTGCLAIVGIFLMTL